MEDGMDSDLEDTKPFSGNGCNGKMRKQVQTEYGLVEVETSHDCDALIPQLSA